MLSSSLRSACWSSPSVLRGWGGERILRMTAFNATREASSIAVLGGGLAGTYCAHLLAKAGLDVTLYDMGRSGYGGRSSTRLSEGFQFDHGCQILMPETPECLQFLKHLEAKGVACPWEGRFADLNAQTGQLCSNSPNGFCGFAAGKGWPYIGMPGMSAICNHLASHDGITQRWNCKVHTVEENEDSRWRILSTQRSTESTATEEVEQGADFLVVTDPMMALEDLPGSVKWKLKRSYPVLQQLKRPKKLPTLTLMAVLDTSLDSLAFDAAIVSESKSLKWISRDSKKPGRERSDEKECWVAITTPELAEELMNQHGRDLKALTVPLEQEFRAVLQMALGKSGSLPKIIKSSTQCWGSAFKTNLVSERSLLDTTAHLAACGDFCVESSAEGALLSARNAAEQIEDYLRGKV